MTCQIRASWHWASIEHVRSMQITLAEDSRFLPLHSSSFPVPMIKATVWSHRESKVWGCVEMRCWVWLECRPKPRARHLLSPASGTIMTGDWRGQGCPGSGRVLATLGCTTCTRVTLSQRLHLTLTPGNRRVLVLGARDNGHWRLVRSN